MSDLSERLRSWAQNEEMVDQYYTDHGDDCNTAAAGLERLQAVVDAARVDVWNQHINTWDDSGTERVQCMCAVCIAFRALDGEKPPCPICDNYPNPGR